MGFSWRRPWSLAPLGTPTNLLSKTDLLVSRIPVPRLGSRLPSARSGQGPYTFCALKEVTLVISSGSREGTALS